MHNNGVKINNGEVYEQFHCKDEGFVLATFDPNTWDYVFKLKDIQGIKDVYDMSDKEGIVIRLEDNLELVGLRRKKGKLMEYEIVVNSKLSPNLESDNPIGTNKIVERRIVTQDWYETEFSKTGWDSHGWRFDDGTYIEHRENWTIVEHIRSNKFGNPIIGIAEKETVL